MKRTFPFLFGLLLLATPLLLQAQFTYTVNPGGTSVTITGSSLPGGPVGSLSIPSTTNGLTVTTIGVYALANSTSLTSLTIPGTVTYIGDGAFYYCPTLLHEHSKSEPMRKP